MSNIFVGQSSLRIQATCNVDITDALTLEIRYRKPDGTEGSWDATEGTAATGVIYYDLTETTELDQSGTWAFWAYIMFSDGRVAAGKSFNAKINPEGR